MAGKTSQVSNRLAAGWLAIAALWLALGAPVQAETTYQVEVVVFARDDADGEDALRGGELRYPPRTVALGPEGSAPFQQLPAANLLLTREAAALAQRRNLRVLAHKAWLWPAEEPARATAIAINGGRQVGAHHELEGYIALGVDHFLHIDTQFWLSRFGAAYGETPTLPAAPGVVAEPTIDNTMPSQVFLLRERRRMRSGELHYFDHARLGLLVQVTPLAAGQ